MSPGSPDKFEERDLCSSLLRRQASSDRVLDASMTLDPCLRRDDEQRPSFGDGTQHRRERMSPGSPDKFDELDLCSSLLRRQASSDLVIDASMTLDPCLRRDEQRPSFADGAQHRRERMSPGSPDKFDELDLCSSLLRRQESTDLRFMHRRHWIPAFAGMTSKGRASPMARSIVESG